MRNGEAFKGTADAAVVGGGCIGLAVARELGRCGLSVTLIERARPGAEASSAAAGMLAPQAEADQVDPFFELSCASRDLYPAFAEALREETGVDVELDRTGTLYLAFNEEDEEEVEERYRWQKRAGLQVERLTAEETLMLEPNVSPSVRLGLRFPLDAQVENRRLVAALAMAAEAHGVRIQAGTEVTALRTERGRLSGVETSRGFLSAGVVVIAAGAWSSQIPLIPSVFGTGSRGEPPRIEPVRGQMLCFEARPPLVRHVVYSPRGYIVPRRDGRLLAGSTSERAGFDKCVTGNGAHAVATHALEIAHAVGDLPLVDAWAGLRPCAGDEWPVLGACADVRGLFYATGHYRNGILLTPITGELIAEMIVNGNTPPMLEAFTPERLCRTSGRP